MKFTTFQLTSFFLHALYSPYEAITRLKWVGDSMNDERFSRGLLMMAIMLVLFMLTRAGVGWPWCMVALVSMLIISLLLCVATAQQKHPSRAFWPRSMLPLLPEEFQEQVGRRALAFTHRSDMTPVLSLQAKVFWQRMSTLRHLDLFSLSRDDRQRLPRLLCQTMHMEKFSLRHSFLDEADGDALVHAFGSQPLEEVCFESVRLCHSAVHILCQQRRWLLKPTVLKLCSCKLGNAEASLVAAALPQACHLAELDLSRNLIRNAGAIALATVLQTSLNSDLSELETLDLSENWIRNRGVQAFALVTVHKGRYVLVDLSLNLDFCTEESLRAELHDIPATEGIDQEVVDLVFGKQINTCLVVLFLFVAIYCWTKWICGRARCTAVAALLSLSWPGLCRRCPVMNSPTMACVNTLASLVLPSTYIVLYDRLDAQWAKLWQV